MPNNFKITPKTIHTVEITNYELADKLKEVAEETGSAVNDSNILFFVEEMAMYPDSEIRELYEEAKKHGSWLWVQLMVY
jgi:hypothetical protein